MLAATLEKHLVEEHIQSVQRRGQFIYVTLVGDPAPVEIYDLGLAHAAQNCLTALTDCLRNQRKPVKVLMPVAAG